MYRDPTPSAQEKKQIVESNQGHGDHRVCALQYAGRTYVPVCMCM